MSHESQDAQYQSSAVTQPTGTMCSSPWGKSVFIREISVWITIDGKKYYYLSFSEGNEGSRPLFVILLHLRGKWHCLLHCFYLFPIVTMEIKISDVKYTSYRLYCPTVFWVVIVYEWHWDRTGSPARPFCIHTSAALDIRTKDIQPG